MDEHKNDESFDEIGPDRRAFVKRVAAVTAFAAPMIASYDLESLSQSVARGATTSNFTSSNR